MSLHPRYEAEPTYAAEGGAVRRGWDAVREALPRGGVLAVDGPVLVDWAALAAAMPSGCRIVDMREHFADWEHVGERTAGAAALAGDVDFATLPSGVLGDLIDDLPRPVPAAGLTLVFGPGAALVRHDLLWYADVPKRYAEAATAAGRGRNLGAPAGEPATTRRLFYLDWPLLDRHRDAIAAEIDAWVDLQDPGDPRILAGSVLRRTLAALAHQPVRTRPTFNTTSWGGHWAQKELGMNTGERNTALGYELIAPESGILIGDRHTGTVEVPFQLMIAAHPAEVLGEAVYATFGSSFPIRFDYLDTYGGGSLSVHCHPRADYMREVFGWPYTQHETYYVMVGSAENVVYLGLRTEADVDAFERQAHEAHDHGEPFDISQYVRSHPAEPHQLFLIPAGTPHGSGPGNVVLEISATPYLYSLRFYDWLRRDAEGKQRPVHIGHAFRNLDRERDDVAALIQQPRTTARGDGWRDDLIGALPEMFFRVHRLEVAAGAIVPQDTDGRFQVLNVVDGAGIRIRTAAGEHPLAFAESIVIPAGVGRYELVAEGAARVVKAFVG